MYIQNPIIQLVALLERVTRVQMSLVELECVVKLSIRIVWFSPFQQCVRKEVTIGFCSSFLSSPLTSSLPRYKISNFSKTNNNGAH